ncbi:MAG: hypothetical protein U5K56_02635 [Halioglobus sp.]|nr:hypothetical protein [Halioglobus sp.]
MKFMQHAGWLAAAGLFIERDAAAPPRFFSEIDSVLLAIDARADQSGVWR